MHDLVVRGGTVVDGTGGPPRTADVAVDDGRISAVGSLAGAAARRTLDADGLLVTPGVVDVHTHYDGQVTWDPFLTPSAWHGVTTVVMGNCGVGFAPVRPGSEAWLVQLMEGVEDIPGTALSEGITWVPTSTVWGSRSTASRYCGKVSQPQVMPSLSAVPGMSSTPSMSWTSHPSDPGRTGAKPTPQLPMTTVVTPCQALGVRNGSHVTWPS